VNKKKKKDKKTRRQNEKQTSKKRRETERSYVLLNSDFQLLQIDFYIHEHRDKKTTRRKKKKKAIETLRHEQTIINKERLEGKTNPISH
jgi:hypothetical protein